MSSPVIVAIITNINLSNKLDYDKKRVEEFLNSFPSFT